MAELLVPLCRRKTTNPYENPRFIAAFPDGLRPGGLELTKEALDFCSFAPGSFLVDLGCGTGVTLDFLKKSGFKVFGLDKSDKLLDSARLKGEVQKASFESLPLEDKVADGLFCECVFSLAQDKFQALKEIRRVLKTGGFFIISDLFPKKPLDSEPDNKPTPEPGTCAAGAVSLHHLENLLITAGFTVKYYKDHEKALKSLAARLVWEYGSLANLAKLWSGDAVGCLGGRNLTYGLVVAQAV
ncbi:MAG: class I SAM-dependent methyltransferase [Deltaproteobacteria bacterium]|jgi:SAM-dependent methyltransferase|nr:class I SAM-dependent methyltransferase [Deltaproteobacteria bacterium]